MSFTVMEHSERCYEHSGIFLRSKHFSALEGFCGRDGPYNNRHLISAVSIETHRISVILDGKSQIVNVVTMH